MDFKNAIELDLDLDIQYQENNKCEITPKLIMKIYCKEDEQNNWELKKNLQFYNLIDLENLNQIYLNEIEKLQQPPQLPPQSDFIDPDDIPF